MSDHKNPEGIRVLQDLFDLIQTRKGADPSTSYSARLLAGGRETIARKLNEEALEVLIAALNESPERLVSESADMLYHLLVLWAAAEVEPEQVWHELASRTGTSGIEEKRTRTQSNPAET